ncbi:MAG: hypothetical protein RJQ09_03740 [Cyclobacteriaceae bacterium]
MKRTLLWALNIMAASSLLFFTSCGDDPDPIAPIISIDNGTFSGDIGDEVTANISGMLDGEFVSLTVSKFIGTTLDASYGTGGSMQVTTGLPYTFNYTLGLDGLTEPIRFNFEVIDDNDLTGSADLIITTNASREQLLVSFDWRWASQEFEGAATLQDCEADNVWSFEADGSVSLDFGALTGSGGGSCDSDGLLTYDGWAMNSASDTLRIFRGNAFSGAAQDTTVFAIKTFDQSGWTADETNLFGVFGWGFEAQAKN